MLILALLCGLIGSTYAKYVKQQTLEGTVTIKANLGKIELLEHEAVRLSTGEYELTEKLLPVHDNPETTDVDETDLGNEYILLPGLDIPKDPFVQITAKTPIKAYVFIKVVTNIDTDNKDMTTDTDPADDHNVSYTLTDNWLQISQAEKDGVITTVYVYTADGANPATVDECVDGDGTGTIQILKDKTIYVSQKLNVPQAGVYLNFSACMYEVASVEKTVGQSELDHAKEVYSQNNP